MKIAVMGAGGIGGYLGGRLAEAGETVHLIGRGRHLDAIRRDGLTIESPHGDLALSAISATDDPGDVGPVDLVLFTVKVRDAAAAAKAIRPMVGDGTRVVTLQNGIDAPDIVGAAVGREKVAPGIIYLAAYIKEPGVIFNPGGIHRMVVDRKGDDPVMGAFFEACDRAIGVEAIPTDDPEHTLWHKFIAMVGFSGVTTITRLPVGAVYENPHALAFMRQLIDEAVAIAQARGLSFDGTHTDDTIDLFRKQPYVQKSSMLVDLEAGKPLELAAMSGRLHELGLAHGIPTPANSAVLAALAAHADGPPKVTPDGGSA